MVTGQNAQLNVEVETRRAAEPAVILLQLTVVQIVRDTLRKHKNATHKLALVSQLNFIKFLSVMNMRNVKFLESPAM